MNGLPFSEYLSEYSSEIILRTQQHALLSLYCIAAATVLGLLIAVAAYRSPLAANFSIATAAVFFTLPSVALFGFLVSVVGYGLVSVFPVVVGYAMLPIIRNGIVGLQSADPAVLDAARGMGVGSFRMLWQVRMPIAWPVLLAGIRVSAQLTVGVVAIAAFVGEARPGPVRLLRAGQPRLGEHQEPGARLRPVRHPRRPALRRRLRRRTPIHHPEGEPCLTPPPPTPTRKAACRSS